MKITKRFQFTFQLQKRVVDLRAAGGYRFDHIDLLIEGVGYDHGDRDERFSADIESISYDGKDILPVIELTEIIEDIYTACCAHVSYLFTENVAA